MYEHITYDGLIKRMMDRALASDKKYVHLNRPFVYMIVDCKVNFPVFIGTVTEIV